MKQTLSVTTGGLEPPKRDAHLICSQIGTNRHVAEMTGFEPILTGSKPVTLTVELHPNILTAVSTFRLIAGLRRPTVK